MQIGQEIEEKKILVGGLESSYKLYGEGNLLLILHGWGGSSDSWTIIQKFLAEKNFKVIAPDLPGFGESQSPKNPWSINKYVNWFYQFCESQNLSKFFLLGHSFGGAVALKFAAKYPEKISLLILIAPAVVRQKKLKQYFYFSLSKIGKLLFSLPILSFFEAFFRKFFYKILGLSDFYKLLLKKDIVMQETFKKIVREDLKDLLPKVKSKTLILWGNKDRAIPVKDAYILKEKIENSTLKIIPGVGHNPHFQIPEELTEIILKFIKA